jgi:hypothetical protein
VKLIDIELDRALSLKDHVGRQTYRPEGGAFIGEPMPELFEELLDAIIYAREARRQGHQLPGVVEELRGLAERVRMAWRAAEAR